MFNAITATAYGHKQDVNVGIGSEIIRKSAVLLRVYGADDAC